MERLRQPYYLYLLLISAIGLVLMVFGISLYPSINDPTIFWLLLGLAAVAQLSSISLPDKGINFEVGTAVALAVVPFVPPLTATLVVVGTSVAAWLLRPANQKTWKKTWSQLFFNNGMHACAMFLAASSWHGVSATFDGLPLLQAIMPWVVAAVVYDQVNFGLLMIIIRLQQGSQFKPFQAWQENLWAVPISLATMIIGGGLLALAVDRYELISILIFFLPIVTSAYAFRLYIRKVQSHMDNLEEIVAERTRELADLNREKDVFLAVLTHDMKSPLSTIGLYANMIKQQPEIILQRPKLPDILLRSQKSLLDIVENILDLEKLNSEGALTVERAFINFGLLTKSVMDELSVQAEKSEVRLDYETEPFLSVWADYGMLRRVVINLVSNAIKYTPAGGSINIQVSKEAEQVVLRVEDNGYGIPEPDLPLIFERYHRVEANRDKAKGTGLGLAVAKALVEANDGAITVTSTTDVGSIFTVTLPFKAPTVSQQAEMVMEPAGYC